MKISVNITSTEISNHAKFITNALSLCTDTLDLYMFTDKKYYYCTYMYVCIYITCIVFAKMVNL
jgi:hypothetical protein